MNSRIANQETLNTFSQQLNQLLQNLQQQWQTEKHSLERLPQFQQLGLENKWNYYVIEKLKGLQQYYDNDLKAWKNNLEQEKKQVREGQLMVQELQGLKSQQRIWEQSHNELQKNIVGHNVMTKQKDNVNTHIGMIQYKDNQMRNNHSQIQQKDNEINKINALTQQKDNEMIKNNILIRQKDDEIKNINTLIKQKDDEIKQHKSTIKQKDIEHSRVTTLNRQQEQGIERLKLQLDNALREIDQSKLKLVESDIQNGTKYTDYESKIAELKEENSQLSQDLDKMKESYQSQILESQIIYNSNTENTESEIQHEVDNELIKTQNSNDIQQHENSSYISQSSMITQKSMNCMRFMQHQCEVHGKPIEYLCIDQICNHASRKMCRRCGRKGASNVVHIENIIECLLHFSSQELQVTNIKKAQLWQLFQNINNQIIEQLFRISEYVDIQLQQVEGHKVVEWIINELISQDNISIDQIENLAGQIATVITQDSEDECKITINQNIDEEQSFINCQELLTQQIDFLKQLQDLSLSVQTEVQTAEPKEKQMIPNNC